MITLKCILPITIILNFYFRNFENGLIRSGAELNVTVRSMYPVKNHFLRRNCRLSEIRIEVTNFFNKAKADGIELIVVIIPDGPAGVYGI